MLTRMLVRHFMSTAVTALDAATTCEDAWTQFRDMGIRRAPVVKDGLVLGMITDRDLLRALPWNIGQMDTPAGERNPTRPVEELLTHDLISIEPGAHLESVAELMLRHKIGGLPVTLNGKLKGIITESDLLRTFVNRKARARGTRLTLYWPEESEQVADPTRIALDTGMQLHEYVEHPSPGNGVLVGLRVAGDGIETFLERILDAGYVLLDRENPSTD